MNHSKNPVRTSSRKETHSNKSGSGFKKWKLSVLLLLIFLPILIISGIAFSGYLIRPPELPPDDANTGVTAGDGTSETGQTDKEPATPPKPVKQFKDDFYTFVITGNDYEGYHTDTIIVVALDTAARKAHLVSVPRDSQVDVPGSYKKINGVYANGGTKELKRQLQSILGFAPQYSIRVDLKAFPKLVNAVGGVEYDVPQDMDYDDNAQNLHIHLQKGRQLLNGDKALQLVRFRGYPSADLGRMQTQQQFLKALAKKVLSPANILKIDTFIDIFQNDVKTDISLRDLQWFAQQVIKLDPQTSITTQTLPHADSGNYLGQNYLFLSPQDVVDMVNSTVNPYTTDITLDDVHIVRIEDGAQKKTTYDLLKQQEVQE